MAKIRFKINLLFLILLILTPISIHCDSFSGKISTADNNSYFKVLLPKIKEAQKSVYMIMYIAKYYSEYPESPGNILLNELIKINKKGVKVEIILNREDRKNASGLTQDNMNTGAYLAQNGVPVYFDPGNKTTHAKLLVIDEKFVVLGSTNWTYYAFTQNNETSLLIESEPLAKHYLKYFFDLKTKSTLLSKPAE